MTNSIKANGVFHLQVVDVHTGKVNETFTEKNLVVTLGRGNIAKLLGGDPGGKKISKIAVGTSSTLPALSDNAITGSFVKAIAEVVYPEANSVKFSWSIDAGEANGTTIREFGLLNDDDVLCARKVRTDIVKTSAVRLVGSWTLTIS